MATINQAFGQGSDRSKPPGFAELKPEGKGATGTVKGRVNIINDQCMARKQPRQLPNNFVNEWVDW